MTQKEGKALADQRAVGMKQTLWFMCAREPVGQTVDLSDQGEPSNWPASEEAAASATRRLPRPLPPQPTTSGGLNRTRRSAPLLSTRLADPRHIGIAKFPTRPQHEPFSPVAQQEGARRVHALVKFLPDSPVGTLRVQGDGVRILQPRPLLTQGGSRGGPFPPLRASLAMREEAGAAAGASLVESGIERGG